MPAVVIEALKPIQSRLAKLGLYKGAIDGIWGTGTQAGLNAILDRVDPPAATPAAARRLIDPDGFKRFAPNAVPGTLEALEAAALKWNLTERNVLASWLGQMWVESKGFSTLVESMNYSPKGLVDTFGLKRITQAQANQYGRTAEHPADQRAIANIVYGGPWGLKNLGNTQPNDGWDMRGSGVKQITGRANITASGYTAQQLRTDIVASCDAAGHFFVTHGCVDPARARDDKLTTKRVNGGSNGLPDRIAKTNEALKIILV